VTPAGRPPILPADRAATSGRRRRIGTTSRDPLHRHRPVQSRASQRIPVGTRSRDRQVGGEGLSRLRARRSGLHRSNDGARRRSRARCRSAAERRRSAGPPSTIVGTGRCDAASAGFGRRHHQRLRPGKLAGRARPPRSRYAVRRWTYGCVTPRQLAASGRGCRSQRQRSWVRASGEAHAFGRRDREHGSPLGSSGTTVRGVGVVTGASGLGELDRSAHLPGREGLGEPNRPRRRRGRSGGRASSARARSRGPSLCQPPTAWSTPALRSGVPLRGRLHPLAALAIGPCGDNASGRLAGREDRGMSCAHAPVGRRARIVRWSPSVPQPRRGSRCTEGGG
jgi:hypothetical protein